MRFRSMGMALGVVLTVGAIFSATAQAVPEFGSTSYPVSITSGGEGEATNLEIFTTEAGKAECGSFYTGLLSGSSQTMKLHPSYFGCKAWGFISATVTTTGCDYLFHVTTKVSADNFTANVDIDCESESAIRIQAATCDMEFVEGNGFTTVDFSNMTLIRSDLTYRPTVTGLEYLVQEDGLLCPFKGTGLKTGATYTSKEAVTLEGTGKEIVISP